MTRWLTRTVLALLGVLVLGGTEAQAQFTLGLGGGIAQPMGDFGDVVDRGITARGQLGLSLLLAGAHAQVGVTRFPGAEIGGVNADDATILHAGVGGRLGLGLIFVGLNGLYFFGDGDDGVGYVPEVGISLIKLEVVADGRLDGDQKWVGLRAGLKF